MRIDFKRAGGPAPFMNVSGSATAAQTDGEVRSEDSKYQRPLSSDEVNQVRAAAEASLRPQNNTRDLSDNSQLLTGFQYDITVTSTDGKSNKIKINAANKSELQKLPDDVAKLLAWVEEECDKILENRVQAH